MKALVLVLASIFFAPVAGSAQSLATKKIKVLSWNIYMLPGFLGTGKSSRAEAIGRLLAESDYDVIVFQEAFHRKSRRIISRHLQPAFPFQVGPANRRLLSLKTNSGIWIFSRHPITNSESIIFKTRHGIDAFSRKGALMAKVTLGDQSIQIVGTHLQNAGNNRRRLEQCIEIQERLLKQNARLGEPQIICGDFNIDRYRSPDGYDSILQILRVTDGRMADHGYSYDREQNDLTLEPGTQRDLIDYILVSQANTAIHPGERRIRMIRHLWKRGHEDLSDHFALEAEIGLPIPMGTVALSNY